tara:strand:+ start:1736 stop:2965 length:1230 start_codon:yes stop_codon:yes gene_type:complete
VAQENESYPDSAISSWSGFVYQGKVALYHCLKLISEGDEDFELQLDSTDDFAIYKNDTLVSAHQVKAKVGTYRSAYISALEKSSQIELDRVKGSIRYFHISVQLNDTSDYIAGNGEIVKFYSYNNDKYCGLDRIEQLTKSIISQICKNKNITVSPNILNFNYCILSEKISTKAMEIHKNIQVDGETESKAAYTNRITAEQILEEIVANNPYEDKEYFSVDLKNRLYSFLEEKLDGSLQGMTDSAYLRIRNLFEHIRDSDADKLEALCHLIQPSERFSSIQRKDIRRYSTLIESIDIEPIFNNLPHYLDKEKKFYIPTALYISALEEREECALDIRSEMESNDALLKLLYEYNNLIASKATESFMIDTKYTLSADFSDQETRDKIDSNITKSLCINVVTKEEAEERLNDT